MDFRDYRDLKVWQMSLDLAEAVYAASASFPKSEIFGLCAQMRRAVVSIPSNIAEGHARDSTREFLRFISIAMGSLAELETQLLLSRRLGFCDEAAYSSLITSSAEIGRMLRGLQQSLKSRLPPSP